MNLLEKYYAIFNELDESNKKYFHPKSLKNFIFFIDEIKSAEDHNKAIGLIEEYLSVVETNKDLNVKAISASLFSDFLNPLGDIYKNIGFKMRLPFKQLFFIFFHVDFLVYLFFLKYPIPFFCIITIVVFFVKRKINNNKYYGFFY